MPANPGEMEAISCGHDPIDGEIKGGVDGAGRGGVMLMVPSMGGSSKGVFAS